jgi:integrase
MEQNEQTLNSLKTRTYHQHDFIKQGNYDICKICGNKRLFLEQKEAGLLQGQRDDGKKYSVRENRMSFFMPDVWEKMMENMRGKKAKFTAKDLIQTGERINEGRHKQKGDIDFERNTIRLIKTKTKAKKGERTGKPRNIPVNSEFIKDLKKILKDKPNDYQLGMCDDPNCFRCKNLTPENKKDLLFLSTSAFNLAIKKALKKAGIKDYYMYSAHSIRKTHGNWLKILGNYGMMKVDAMEICLRLGHDYNTFLKDYGSAGVMTAEDMIRAKKILGDLYSVNK